MVGIKLEVIKENDTYTAHIIGNLFDNTIFDSSEFTPNGLNLYRGTISYQASLAQLYEEAQAFGYSVQEIDVAVQNAVQFF